MKKAILIFIAFILLLFIGHFLFARFNTPKEIDRGTIKAMWIEPAHIDRRPNDLQNGIWEEAYIDTTYWMVLEYEGRTRKVSVDPLMFDIHKVGGFTVLYDSAGYENYKRRDARHEDTE